MNFGMDQRLILISFSNNHKAYKLCELNEDIKLYRHDKSRGGKSETGDFSGLGAFSGEIFDVRVEGASESSR